MGGVVHARLGQSLHQGVQDEQADLREQPLAQRFRHPATVLADGHQPRPGHAEHRAGRADTDGVLRGKRQAQCAAEQTGAQVDQEVGHRPVDALDRDPRRVQADHVDRQVEHARVEEGGAQQAPPFALLHLEGRIAAQVEQHVGRRLERIAAEHQRCQPGQHIERDQRVGEVGPGRQGRQLFFELALGLERVHRHGWRAGHAAAQAQVDLDGVHQALAVGRVERRQREDALGPVTPEPEPPLARRAGGRPEPEGEIGSVLDRLHRHAFDLAPAQALLLAAERRGRDGVARDGDQAASRAELPAQQPVHRQQDEQQADGQDEQMGRLAVRARRADRETDGT